MKSLSKRRCIQLEVEAKGKVLKALLDSGSEINLISRAMVKQLGLPPSLINEKACGIANTKLETFGVHFLTVAVTDKNGNQRFFEESFLEVSINEDLIFGMPWLELATPNVDWRNHTIEWSLDSVSMMPTARRLEIIDGELMVDDLLAGDSAAYVLHVRIHKEDAEDLRSVHKSRRARISVALQDKETGEETEVAIPKEWQHIKEPFREDLAYELPEHGPSDHAIDLEEGAQPPYGPIYSLSESELKVLRAYIEKHLANGFIRPSKSPAGAPILFVKKKDGSLRLCVDYRGLNSLTIKNRYPLPLIGESLDRLSRATIYSKFDITSAYHRMRIKKGDEWKTAFRTRYGHYEYQVLPFGLTNAPASFQAYINTALAEKLDVCVIVYLDDIIVYSSSPEQHDRDVCWVLEQLALHKLYVAKNKCQFRTTSIDFLGYRISPAGVEMQEDKVESIRTWPQPESPDDVTQFLGLANFYRRFIKNFSRITAPLTELLKGTDAFVKKSRRRRRSLSRSRTGISNGFLTGEAARAFEALKEAFMTAPVLRHFDPAKPLRIETDASDKAIGAILCQPDDEGHWHPIAFLSRKLIPAECNYEVHDKELLAIVESFKHWRHYLEGAVHEVLVLTDHHNLKKFMETTKLSPRQVRWALELSRYNFRIDYRPGVKNPADGLSRRPDHMLPTEGEVEENRQILYRLQTALRSADTDVLNGVTKGAYQVATVVQEVTKGAYQVATVVQEVTKGAYQVATVLQEAAKGAYRVAAVAQEPHDRGEADGSRASTACAAWVTLMCGSVYCGYDHNSSVVRALEAVEEGAYLAVPTGLDDILRPLLPADPFACDIRRRVANSDVDVMSDWDDTNGVLRYQGRLYLPEVVRSDLVARNHDDPLAGHFGVEKTLELLQRKYYWPNPGDDADAAPGMRKFVREYCESCAICKRSKAPRHKPYGELRPLPIPEYKWADITMDFVTGLPPSRDWNGAIYDSIFVVVDRLSKMVHYIPCSKTVSAEDLAEIFIREVVRLHGVPSSVVSDRGPVFTSKFWSTLCYCLNITRNLSTAFHPQTDGQTERQNSTMEQYLRAYVNFEQDDWVALLPMAEFAYNNSKNASTGLSPFEVMTGYSPRMTFEEPSDPRAKSVSAKAHAKHLDSLMEVCKEALLAAQKHQKTFADKHSKPIQFAVGDYVWLRGKNIRTKRNRKLEWKAFGPFEILKKHGDQAYKLDLPKRWRIHDVFHVSLLEPSKERERGSTQPAEPSYEAEDIDIEEDGDDEYTVESILDSKVFDADKAPNQPQGNDYGLFYLVKWEDYEESESTWEPASHVKHLRGTLRAFHTQYPKKPDGSELDHRRTRRPAATASKRKRKG